MRDPTRRPDTSSFSAVGKERRWRRRWRLSFPGIRNVPNTEPWNAFPEHSEQSVCPVLLAARRRRARFFTSLPCEFLADCVLYHYRGTEPETHTQTQSQIRYSTKLTPSLPWRPRERRPREKSDFPYLVRRAERAEAPRTGPFRNVPNASAPNAFQERSEWG